MLRWGNVSDDSSAVVEGGREGGRGRIHRLEGERKFLLTFTLKRVRF